MATITGTRRHLGITSDTFDSNGNVVVGGDLTVEGTTTTLDTANLLVEDKNIIIGNVSTPSDTTADGGGITLKGASDYTINWVNANDRWEFNQGIYSSGTLASNGLNINGNAIISGNLSGVDTLTATTLIVTNYGLVSGDIPNNAANTTGLASHATNLNATDDRDIAPEDLTYNDDLRIFFAEKSGIEGGTVGSDYQDLLVLNSYADSSGGTANALGFDKNSKRILHYNSAQTATNWGTPKQLAYTDSDITGEAATVAEIGNLTGHITSVDRATSLGSFTTAELNAAISDGTINSQTLPSDFVSAANGGTFANTVNIADIIDGPFAALRLMNQKTYGSGTGTNEEVRFVMGISESGISFDSREGFAIELGIADQSDSSNGVVNFKVRDGGTLGTYSTVTGSDKSVSFVGDLSINSSLYVKGANERIYMNGGGATNWRGVEVNSSGLWSWGETGVGNYFSKNIGIGTTSTSNLLSLRGSGQNYSTSPAIKMWDSYNSKGWYVGSANNHAAGDFYIRSVTSEAAYPVAANQEFTIKQSGNVGIGTINPDGKLEVLGVDNNTILTLTRGNASQYLTFRGYQMASNGNNMLVSADDTKQVWLGHQSSTSELVVDVGGNVGIGTTTPQSKFDVKLANNTVASIGGTVSAGSYAGLHFGYSEAANVNYRHSAIVFERDDAAHGDARGNIHILNSPGGSTSANLGDARLTITPSGSVGIGTTSPSSKLEVYASGSTVLDIQGSQGQLFSITDNLTGDLFTVSDISGVPIFNVNATGLATVDGVMSIGLNGATPIFTLDVGGDIGTDRYIRHNGDSNTYFGFSGADTIQFNTNSSERLRIDSSGDVFITGQVGIGATPVSPLTVKSNSVSSGESGIVIQANGNTNSIIKLGEKATDGARLEMLDAGVTKIALFTDGTGNYITAGNVGIGVTSPATLLHTAILPVPSSTVANELRIESRTVTGYGGESNINLYTSQYGNPGIYFGNQAAIASQPASIKFTGSSSLLTINTTGAFQVSRSGVPRLNISNTVAYFTGINVGIGMTNPSSKLEVDGDIKGDSFSSDGNAKFYTWRALENTTNGTNIYHRIARITATQSTRFIIELAGRSASYGDGQIPAYGKLVGQLNNDNNYDLIYYDFTNGVNGTSQVVTQIGQVDVSTTATDIYIRNGEFSEITATAHISDGTITPYSNSNGSTSAPSGFSTANTATVWNSTNSSALAATLTSSFPKGSTTNYTTAATSNTDAWYKLFQIQDNNSCPIECHIRSYAHTSLSFIASEGYAGGAAHINILDAHVSSTNSAYKFIEGIRITASGVVEILLNGGSNVSVEMTLIGDAIPESSLVVSTESTANIRDSVTSLSTGMVRAYGDVSVGETLSYTRPTANNQFRGEIVTFGNHGTITAGDLVYLNTSGAWNRAKADTGTTSKALLGVALGTKASDGILLRGFSRSTATFTESVNAGLPLYVSTATAGNATAAIPSTTGHIARIVGYSTGVSSEIYFCPDNTFVEIA